MSEFGIGVALRLAATIRRQLIQLRPSTTVNRESIVICQLECDLGQANYVGTNGIHLHPRMHKHELAMQRKNDLITHASSPGHHIAYSWYPTLTCGSSKLVLLSGHTPGNRHNQVRESGVVCASTPDNPRSNRLERRMVLVAREMVRYKVEIAALSETRFSEQGQLEEVGAGYTFFWSGRPKAERRDAGVPFAIRNDIVGRLPCPTKRPKSLGQRLLATAEVTAMILSKPVLCAQKNLLRTLRLAWTTVGYLHTLLRVLSPPPVPSLPWHSSTVSYSFPSPYSHTPFA
ncbi:unnamed protein product [Schistocephalus solidus]|uniref:Uncharacterized protein n=1 Tax=Schistocephalus solidus TaxID=70667 RepID=A0A183TAX3_SCHSO|nr:unnamed protein product [Schistocephalus solidus]